MVEYLSPSYELFIWICNFLALIIDCGQTEETAHSCPVWGWPPFNIEERISQILRGESTGCSDLFLLLFPFWELLEEHQASLRCCSWFETVHLNEIPRVAKPPQHLKTPFIRCNHKYGWIFLYREQSGRF